jgi:ketosteroid isomerase-like protein
MKRLIVAIVLVLNVSCLIFGQAKPQPSAQQSVQSAVQELTALEQAWLEASRQHDGAWMERYLADTYISTDQNGVIYDKAARIARVKNPARKVESVSYENNKVQVYGDTAIVTGLTVLKGTFEGKDNSGKFQWTDTWVKRGGQWQCVAGHSSTVVAK